MDNVEYDLLKHLRKAQADFMLENDLESGFWCVDLVVHELDHDFEKPLKRVVDWDSGYEFREGRP